MFCLFDIPMCLAHRGLSALLTEMGAKSAVVVNRKWTAAKVFVNNEVIVHIRTAERMTADRLITLCSIAKIDERAKAKIRREYGARFRGVRKAV